MSELDAGLIRPAIVWSGVGLGVGGSGWIAFVAWDIGGEPHQMMSSEMHRLVTTSLAMLILASLSVQLTARVVRGQRRIQAQLEAIAPRVGYPEGYADGLARRPATPAVRHLNSVAPVDS